MDGNTVKRTSAYALAARIFVALILLAAGFSKAVAPRETLFVLAYLMPHDTGGAIAAVVMAVVVGAELGLGLWLLISQRPRLPSYTAVALLTFYTIVLLRLLSDRSAPSCGCLGAFGFASRNVALWTGVARNIALLWLLVWSARSVPQGLSALAASAKRSHVLKGGFTLIETLVVMAIVSVAVALILPSLGGSRYAAKVTRSLALQQQMVTGTTTYGSDFKERLPYFGVPGVIMTPLTIHGTTFSPNGTTLLDHSKFLACALRPDYLDAPIAALEHAGSHNGLMVLGYPEFSFVSRFRFTYTAFAAPEYFAEPPGTVQTLAQLRGTSWHEILFPSSKGLTLDSEMGIFGSDTRFGADLCVGGIADGSAKRFSFASAGPVTVPPLVDWPVPVMSTVDGLHGRDFDGPR